MCRHYLTNCIAVRELFAEKISELRASITCIHDVSLVLSSIHNTTNYQWTSNTWYGESICFFLILFLPHVFQLENGVDVSYETHPFKLVLRFFPRQFSPRQVVSNVIQPPPLRPRHLHRHHCIARILIFSSHHIPLQPTFLHFRGHFSHIRCPSNSFISYSIQQS